MGRRSLPWRLWVVYLAALTAFTLAVGAWMMTAQSRFHREAVREELLRGAQLVAGVLEEAPADAPVAEIDRRVKHWGGSASIRLTVIGPDGVVVADSEAEPSRMDNHADRPEVRSALRGEAASEQRMSATRGVPTLYVAVPLRRDGQVVAAVRASISVAAVEAQVAAQRMRLLAGGAVFVLLAALAGWLAARALGIPLEDIQRGAERFAAGDLSRRIEPPPSKEAAVLADALNRMAADLDARLRTIEHQASEREAVLSAMAEGVIAVDDGARVISVNDAAARLLGIAPAASAPGPPGPPGPIGRPLQEAVRNVALEDLVATVLETGQPGETEIVVAAGGERFVQVHCTVLRDGSGRATGAVLVLADLTRLRHLETVRSEFVANVSHELKTPVTSIKGFVETLRAGAMRDPATTERFLEIIARQAERLSMIIEDLLTLSRLEQDGGGSGLPLRTGSAREIIDSAAQVCESKAAERSVTLDVACDPGLQMRMNPPLLEQALVNLVDNAIKNSEPGSRVTVGAQREGSEVVLTVTDSGCGIEPEHLPRIFERFYRVDKARSRKVGGTGLGLSIVKHIAQAHGGGVSVASEPGRGSVFTLRLPAT